MRECQEIENNGNAAHCFALNIPKDRISPVILGGMVKTILREVEHSHQWIVQFVGEASSKSTDSIHFLRLDKSRLGFPEFPVGPLKFFIRLLKLLLRPPFRFLKEYFLKAGFRDGLPGLVIAASTMFYVFIKYAKLWELGRIQQGSNEGKQDGEL